MRSKIYHNLNTSTFIYCYEGVEFKFSSLLYLNKYIESVGEFVSDNINKFLSRYRVDIDKQAMERLKQYFAIAYYKKIEKRGCKYELRGD